MVSLAVAWRTNEVQLASLIPHHRSLEPSFVILHALYAQSLAATLTRRIDSRISSRPIIKHPLDSLLHNPRYSPLHHSCVLPRPSSHPFTRHHPPDSVTLDPRDTPPPLHYSPATSELERASTAETTPIGTPRGFDSVHRRKSGKEKEKDLLFSWQRRAHGLAGSHSSYVDSALLEDDTEDSVFPLFGDLMNDDMATRTDPINIASYSPWQNHPPHLSSALQSTSGNELRPSQAVNIVAANSKGGGTAMGRRDSSTSCRSGSGAQPISVNRDKPRRESIAGSLVGGMSWGGVSVSSFVRDE